MKRKGIIKTLLCALLVGVVMVTSGTESVKAGWEDWLVNCIREPEYKNDYGKCWYRVWWQSGADAVTQSYYGYGNATQIMLKYTTSKGESDTAKYTGYSTNREDSYAMGYPGKVLEATFYCNAYRFNFQITLTRPKELN